MTLLKRCELKYACSLVDQDGLGKDTSEARGVYVEEKLEISSLLYTSLSSYSKVIVLGLHDLHYSHVNNAVTLRAANEWATLLRSQA